MPAAHRGCPPSTLTEVSYRAPERGRAASGTPDSELKKNEPHAGGPIDRPKRQPRKGWPVISMPEAPGLVMGASRPPARPHEQTGVRHMQARRNPSPAATKTQAGVRVQRQPVRYSRPAPERYLSGYARGAAARPLSHTLIKSARREQPEPQLNYLQYMRRSRTSAQPVCSQAGSQSAGFVAAPSTECGQPRHSWSDEAAQIFKSHEKVHSTVRVRPCLGKTFAYAPRRKSGLTRWCVRCAEQETDV